MFCTTNSVSLVTFFPRVAIVTLTKYLSLTFSPLYDSYGFSAKLKSKRYCYREARRANERAHETTRDRQRSDWCKTGQGETVEKSVHRLRFARDIFSFI